jgi:NADH dehydrogenase
MNIVLIGGSGFLGQYLVRELVADGHPCTVLTRCTSKRREFSLEKGIRLVQADVYSVDVLTRRFQGADAVVSMAGILNEPGFGGKGFQRAHVELVQGIAEACAMAGVTRLLHVSALNAGRGKSHYLRSKGEAEEVLRAADLNLTVFQPSVIFGPGDSFFNRFAGLLALSPVLPLACPNARMQPVFAGDVAAAMAAALTDPATHGRTCQLGGPRDYRLIELVRWIAQTLGLRRRVMPLPGFASRMQATLLDFVPGKPFSTDNYHSLQLDNVTTDNALPHFGIVPGSVESIVPDYLGVSRHQRHLGRIRQRAGR